MTNTSYFGPKLSGGANNISGITYQNLCALICLFEHLNRDEEVLSLSLETINDFAIHQPHRTITAQVKKKLLNIRDIKNILEQTPIDQQHTIMIVASNFNEELEQLIKKRDQFRYAMESDLDESWKEKIVQDFYSELDKRGMKDLENIFINSEYNLIPNQMTDTVLLASVWTWVDKRKLSVNIPQLIKSLKEKIQSLSSKRQSLYLEDILRLANEHSTENIATQIIKQAYESQFITPSKILTILGETKEDILKPLEEKLSSANDLFKSENYSEALDIYLSLATFYPKDEIHIQCAVLYEMLGEAKKAIEYCDKILQNNSSHYPANIIKGTSLGVLKRYNEAISQLEKTLEYSNTPEVHYNLGYIYWLTNNNNKALNHYNESLKLDESFVNAHLNISLCYFHTLNFEQSLFHINKALELNPKLYKAYAQKGEIYKFLGLYDNAIEYFYECLKNNKGNYQALLGISLCFAEKGFLSEAIIYFKSFFEKYYDNFFKENSVGKKSMLIDTEWKRTRYVIFELNNEDQVNVHINNHILPVNLKKFKELIFIGSCPISDDTGSILYPMVGKFFFDEDQYNNVINNIKKHTELFQYFDKPLYTNFDESIQIKIQERKEYILVDIFFDEKYRISGVTDQKTGGFESFSDYFEKHGQCRIHLECTTTKEVFIIDGVREVDIQNYYES